MDFEELQRVHGRSVNFSVSIPVSLCDVLDRIADAEVTTTKAVLIRALRKGLEVERTERAQRAKKEIA